MVEEGWAVEGWAEEGWAEEDGDTLREGLGKRGRERGEGERKVQREKGRE